MRSLPSISLPMILLIGYLGKISIFSASIADSLVILCISCLVVLNEYKITDSKMRKYDEKLVEIHKNQERLEEEVRKAQNAVAAVRISNGFRPSNSKAPPL